MADSRYPRLTILIMLTCFSFFLLQMAFRGFTIMVALTPTIALSGMPWQFITYMFAHGSITHLGLNMIALFIFGSVMERVLGWQKYLTLYMLSGIGSSLLHIALSGISDVPLLGASGAVFAVLTAYAFKFPKNIVFVFPGIPVPAALLVAFFTVFELFSGVFGFEPGIANFGHLGGILVGAVIMLYWRRAEKRGSAPAEFEWVWESW
jgi:membrane associated rhomboid family serine protease